ncbi:MAG: hypothetical protein HFI86_05685 [Bacilli bacterium]|nr:hypothetical protein [Bacilli bacterium]
MQNVKVDRDKYVGGSDIPIIMNISPFKTRWELLQEKAGLIKNEFTGNQYTEYGNVLEPKIRDFINKDLKDKFVEGKDIIDDIRCHTDGINKIMVLEIKTTSQIHKTLEEYKVYLVQLLFYMKYTKRKKGKLAVYERPENFDETFDESRLTIYDIDIKDYKDLLEEIDLAVDDFRNDLRRIKENPFLTEADLEPKDLIEIAKKLEEIETKLSGYDEIVKKRDDLKTQLKDKLDEIGKKQFKTSNYKFTRVADGKDTIIEIFDEDKFKEINEKLYKEYSHEEVSIIFDLDKFKEEHEKEAKKYITTSVKKGKAGYLKMIGIVGECNE